MFIRLVLLVVLYCGSVYSANFTCTHLAKKPAPCLEVEDTKGVSSDSLLFDEDVKKHGMPFIKRSEEFTFPTKEYLAKNPDVKLTLVKVMNKMKPGTEGSVTLTHGGVGHKNVTLYLESRRFQGYDFHITIRGVKL